MNPKDTTQVINLLDPVKIVDITEKGFDFGLWFSVLISIISTSILIRKQIKKSKVYGKVISITCTHNGSYFYTTRNLENCNINGQQYLLKMSLSCIGKSLNYKDVNVFLTFRKKKIRGEIFWSKSVGLIFQNPDGTKSKRKMLTPANNFLTFNSVLEEGKTSFYYLNFIIPNKEDKTLYDKLELEFIKPNNKKVNVEIFEIDPKQSFFDDKLILN